MRKHKRSRSNAKVDKLFNRVKYNKLSLEDRKQRLEERKQTLKEKQYKLDKRKQDFREKKYKNK